MAIQGRVKSKRFLGLSKHIVIGSLLIFLFLPGSFAAGIKEGRTAPKEPEIKNIIFMIPDGMSIGGVTLARWFKGGQSLALDEMASGLVRTHNADTPIADSAPAGTAFATGYKTNSPYISVLPSKSVLPGAPQVMEPFKPVATILEAARLSGKATGLVTTCEIPHATPASFSAHVPNRRNYDDIIEQQVYNGLTVVFSGGHKFLLSENRKDKENLVNELQVLGYLYIRSKAEFDALPDSVSNPVWGLFADVDLAYELDRDPKREPSLAEMTQKAIDILSKDPDGFFLMVEGSKIDWAAHANEPVALVHDIIAFDEAVKVAVSFAKNRKDTVVIAVSDHGNSGITMGDRTTSRDYDKIPVDSFIKPLKNVKHTGYLLPKLLKEDRSNIKEVMASVYGIQDLSEDELKMIHGSTKLDGNSGMDIVGKLIATRAKLGFTTGGHTGEDMVLFMYVPDNSIRLFGTVQNSDLAWYAAKLLKVDLKSVDTHLYSNANEVFKAYKATLSTDKSNPDNPLLKVSIEGREIVFPENKNYCLVDKSYRPLDGVNVFIEETNSWYVSRKVLEYLK